MARLVKMGNSQGIRIPKTIIEQISLEAKELEFKIIGSGLLITPISKPREGRAEQIQATLHVHGNETIDHEWLESELTSDYELEW